MFICGLLGGPRPLPTVNQNILSGSPEHPYLVGPARSEGSIVTPDPRGQSSLPILKRVQAGISRCRLYRKQPTKVRLPLTAEVLLRIQQATALVSHSNRPVVWAVAAIAFFGFFRLGELLPAARASFHEETDLSWGDVAVDSHDTPQMVKVHLKKSKCDQFGKGVDIYLGRTDTVLCPVKALLTYIEWRGSHPGPFFLDSSKACVTKPWFITQLLAYPTRTTPATASGSGLPPRQHWWDWMTPQSSSLVGGRAQHSCDTFTLRGRSWLHCRQR